MFLSCEKDLHSYDGKSVIYFNEAGRLPTYSGEVIKDSTIMSFSLSTVQDSIVNMVVKIAGAPQDIDRPYILAVNSNSDAVQGLHYDILNTEYSIKRNQMADTVRVKFYRKADMQEKSFLLSFDLLDNAYFSTDMKNKITNVTTNASHSYINYRWYVNDIIKKPSRWIDSYFGIFSRKKLFLLVEILGVDPAYMDTSMAIAEGAAYAKFMQRYLNDQKAAGNIIYEEDGVTAMVMGSAAQ